MREEEIVKRDKNKVEPVSKRHCPRQAGSIKVQAEKKSWQTRSWKARAMVSSMPKELANVMRAAVTGGDMDVARITISAEIVGVNRRSASMRARRSAVHWPGPPDLKLKRSECVGHGRSEGWKKLFEKYSKRTMGRMFRVQRECMYPKAVRDVSQVKLAIMQWDEVLLSMSKIPSDDVLGSLCKLMIRESDPLKTVLELYDMEIHQKISMPNDEKLKTMVKRSIDQKLHTGESKLEQWSRIERD